MVVYLSLARLQYELTITDDETLKKSFHQFIAKIKEERKKKL
jgi:molybdate-binding protein